MAPITWRNVGGPNFSSSNELQVAATQQLKNALGQVGGAFNEFTQGRAANQQKVTDLNTQDLLNRVQGINNLDEYARAQGQFNQSALAGQNIDLAKVLSAYESRENTLQSDYVDDTNFANTKRAEAENPLIAEYNTRIANASTPEEYAAIKAEAAADTRIRERSGLVNSAQQKIYDYETRQDQLLQKTRKEEEYQQGQGLNRLTQEFAKSQIRAKEQGIENANRFAEQYNSEFGSPIVSVDSTGQLLYSDSAPDWVKEEARNAYAQFTSENPIETPNYQDYIGRILGADGTPAQKESALNTFKAATDVQEQLPQKGREQVAKIQAGAEKQESLLREEHAKSVQRIKDNNKLTYTEAEFSQAVDPSEALNILLDKAPGGNFIALGTGGENLVLAYNDIIEEGYTTGTGANAKRVDYPGVVLKRAAALVPVNDEWFGSDNIEMDSEFKKILNREMYKYIQDTRTIKTIQAETDAADEEFNKARQKLYQSAESQTKKVASNFGVTK